MTGLYSRMRHLAQERPRATALVHCRRDGSAPTVAFAQLLSGCGLAAQAFRAAGVRRGNKAVVMTADPYHLVTTVYGLVAIGAVPVLVDPGLPRADLRQCLDEVAPEVFVGQPLAQLARTVLGWGRGHVRTPLVTGPALPGLGRRLRLPVPPPGVDGGLPDAEAAADDLALIAFTSGSTGVPKGVEYRHGTLVGQADALGGVLGTDGVLFAGFLPFVLFAPLLGLTVIAPAVNHRAPARTPPDRLLRPLLEHRASVVAGSPAVLGLLADHCACRGLTLPGVGRVVSFGAPLRTGLAQALHAVLPPRAEVLSAYGSTECLPVSAVSTAEQCGPGAGTCVGRPLGSVAARILDPDHDGIGEIAVTGANVSPAYHARPQATAAAKSMTADGVLHRMGDMGVIDEQGRLWFHGRRSHRVLGPDFVLTTEPAEAAASAVPGVRRAALVGIGPPGRQQAVLCVELDGRETNRRTVLGAVRTALDRQPAGRRVADLLIHPGFPTDIRHNSKIDRERLAAWAARRLRRPQ
ncbi:AMP-binding protein [Kitasatospora sp. NPDC096077]|uniref:AMP-binding protein n=1 Tax=Kitasatospora sp. NPDC096077 TaxID=3155544 RepID=UPI00332962B7